MWKSCCSSGSDTSSSTDTLAELCFRRHMRAEAQLRTARRRNATPTEVRRTVVARATAGMGQDHILQEEEEEIDELQFRKATRADTHTHSHTCTQSKHRRPHRAGEQVFVSRQIGFL